MVRDGIRCEGEHAGLWMHSVREGHSWWGGIHGAGSSCRVE